MTRFHQQVALISFCLLQASWAHSMQDHWKLAKEKNGVKVYTRNLDSRQPIEAKVEFQMQDVTICQLIAVLKDVEGYCEWTYNCLDSFVLNQINEREAVEYYAFDFPWPFSNRDIVTQSIISIEEETRKVTVDNWALDSAIVPTKSHFVRMTKHRNRWIFTPVGEKTFKIEYHIRTSPGGYIPNWIVNLAIDHGAYRTIDQFTRAVRDRTNGQTHIRWLGHN